MSNPNKTVANAARNRAFDAQKQAQRDDARSKRGDTFVVWLTAQAMAGRRFNTLDEARASFEAEKV